MQNGSSLKQLNHNIILLSTRWATFLKQQANFSVVFATLYYKWWDHLHDLLDNDYMNRLYMCKTCKILCLPYLLNHKFVNLKLTNQGLHFPHCDFFKIIYLFYRGSLHANEMVTGMQGLPTWTQLISSNFWHERDLKVQLPARSSAAIIAHFQICLTKSAQLCRLTVTLGNTVCRAHTMTR